MKKMFWITLLVLSCSAAAFSADSKSTAKAKKELQNAIKSAGNNNFEKMYESAKKAQALDPRLAGPYAYSGLYLYRVGQFDAAEKEFQKCLTLDANFAMARAYLGNILFDRGESERALDEWNASVRLDSKSPEALASIAVGLFGIGKTTEAVQQYKKALMYDRRYYEPDFLLDRKKGAAWGRKKVDAAAPLLQKIEKPKFPYSGS